VHAVTRADDALEPKQHEGIKARVHRIRMHTFGPASEEPYRRRPRDMVRLGVAVVVMVFLAQHADDVTATEQSIFEFFNSLPDGLESLFVTLYRLGALWAVGLVVAAALLDRRWRLARDLAISGGLAWVVGRILGAIVVEKDTLGGSLDVITRFGDTPSFPLVRLAVVVAVVAAAAPYVSRPSRRVGGVLVLLLALASMYLGTAFPNDALAAVVLGWGLAAAVHLAFKSPGGRPTAPQVQIALGQLGVDARNVHLDPVQHAGSTAMVAEDAGGALTVKVIGRDEADSQLIAKVGRWIAYKDSGPTMYLSRLQQVEHEAYTMLLAQGDGVRVPRVLVAGTGGPGAALLVSRTVEGPRLADVEPKQVTQKLLVDLWKQVAQLHDARVSHGALNTRNVIVGPDGPAIVEFSSSSAASQIRQCDDVAELLASTAALVGEERAVRAAHRGIGTDALAGALPFLQPAALGRSTRSLSGAKRKEVHARLAKLRTLGAEATGTEEPVLQELHRVSPTNLAMAIGTLVAVFVLLGQIGSPQELYDTLKNADWWYVLLAFTLSMLTNFGYAIALMGTVPKRLPIWPTTETQVAMSFSNLAIPAVGGIAVQVRYLQKQGVDLASAVASGGLLSTVANVVAQIMLFFIALWLAPNKFDTGNIDTQSVVQVVLLIALVLVVAVGLVLGVPKLRKSIVPPVKRGASTMWEALRSPKRIFFLVSGNFLASLLYGLCLLACVEAYGGSVSFWSLLAANIFIGTIASLVPIPGGNTAVSSIGMSGALVAFGVPDAVAVAAVLTNQLVVSYLPAIPGWFATNDMLKRDYL
jgi:undecaprenyl-diphosphatase